MLLKVQLDHHQTISEGVLSFGKMKRWEHSSAQELPSRAYAACYNWMLAQGFKPATNPLAQTSVPRYPPPIPDNYFDFCPQEGDMLDENGRSRQSPLSWSTCITTKLMLRHAHRLQFLQRTSFLNMTP
jgi:hypothetical protein